MYRRVSGVCAAITAVVFCAACSSESGNQPEATVATTEATILLQDRFGENGVLTVAEDEGGTLSINVQGRIGVDDDQAASAALALDTLEKTYLALHPEQTEAPEKVREVSGRVQAQRALQLKDGAGVAPVSVEPPTNLQDKDLAGFMANACKRINGNFEFWEPKGCHYGTAALSVCTGFLLSSFGPDKSEAWNENSVAATHSLSGLTTTFNIPAFNWSVVTYGGVYSNRRACLTLNGGARGNLGVTYHRYTPDPH